MRVIDPRMAAGKLVCRDVKVAQDSDGTGKPTSAIKAALGELLSLLRNAPGHDTSSDRLRIWVVADGPDVLSVWGVKGDSVGPSVSKEIHLGVLVYDGLFDDFSGDSILLGYPQGRV